ncbi:MAG: TIGR03936 family radical SAM-associated protein [Anaerolineales bacterium]
MQIRFRLIFAKLEMMRFTGHLDLYKTWERTFRRANLPIKYSQGYNPRPRINIGAALPLGFTGENEMMDVWFEDQFTPEKVTKRLEPALPPGLLIKSIQGVKQDSPSLQKLISASDYIVTLTDFINELPSRLTGLISKKEIWRERRGKSYDLRPLIIDISDIQPDDNTPQKIRMRLLTKEGATGRPDEVLSAIGIAPEETRIHRLRLIIN